MQRFPAPGATVLAFFYTAKEKKEKELNCHLSFIWILLRHLWLIHIFCSMCSNGIELLPRHSDGRIGKTHKGQRISALKYQVGEEQTPREAESNKCFFCSSVKKVCDSYWRWRQPPPARACMHKQWGGAFASSQFGNFSWLTWMTWGGHLSAMGVASMKTSLTGKQQPRCLVRVQEWGGGVTVRRKIRTSASKSFILLMNHVFLLVSNSTVQLFRFNGPILHRIPSTVVSTVFSQ